jgi:hypothetical protein
VDSTILDLGEDLSGFLATLGQPIEQTAREMIVFELYRRSLVAREVEPTVAKLPDWVLLRFAQYNDKNRFLTVAARYAAVCLIRSRDRQGAILELKEAVTVLGEPQ